MNKPYRREIVKMVCQSREGHIPSAFSIIDIIAHLYHEVLRVDPKNPLWEDRDYFVLSKGHGCAALYVVLARLGFFPKEELGRKSRSNGILGGHPDITCVPGAEASTGSLGHGLPFALGIALGLKIRNKPNRVFVLIGDGESNEGTVWESAAVAANMKLGSMCCILDNNGSADQVLAMPDQKKKWESFGWETREINGHDQEEIASAFSSLEFSPRGAPKMIVANTVKGKGVPLLEGHGEWHYKIPEGEDYQLIMNTLT